MDKGLLGEAEPAAILVGSASPSMGYTVLPSHTNTGLKLQVCPPYLQMGRGKAVEDIFPVYDYMQNIKWEHFIHYSSVYICGAEENPTVRLQSFFDHNVFSFADSSQILTMAWPEVFLNCPTGQFV